MTNERSSGLSYTKPHETSFLKPQTNDQFFESSGPTPLPVKPKGRRKKLIKRTERDEVAKKSEAYYNSIDERGSIAPVPKRNDVDLEFLERKRLLLKRKQDILNQSRLQTRNNLDSTFQSRFTVPPLNSRQQTPSEVSRENDGRSEVSRTNDQQSEVSRANDAKRDDRAQSCFSTSQASGYTKIEKSPVLNYFRSSDDASELKRDDSVRKLVAAKKNMISNSFDKNEEKELEGFFYRLFCCANWYSVLLYLLTIVLALAFAFAIFKIYSILNVQRNRDGNFHRSGHQYKHLNETIQSLRTQHRLKHLEEAFNKLSKETLMNLTAQYKNKTLKNKIQFFKLSDVNTTPKTTTTTNTTVKTTTTVQTTTTASSTTRNSTTKTITTIPTTTSTIPSTTTTTTTLSTTPTTTKFQQSIKNLSSYIPGQPYPVWNGRQWVWAQRPAAQTFMNPSNLVAGNQQSTPLNIQQPTYSNYYNWMKGSSYKRQEIPTYQQASTFGPLSDEYTTQPPIVTNTVASANIGQLNPSLNSMMVDMSDLIEAHDSQNLLRHQVQMDPYPPRPAENSVANYYRNPNPEQVKPGNELLSKRGKPTSVHDNIDPTPIHDDDDDDVDHLISRKNNAISINLNFLNTTTIGPLPTHDDFSDVPSKKSTRHKKASKKSQRAKNKHAKKRKRKKRKYKKFPAPPPTTTKPTTTTTTTVDTTTTSTHPTTAVSTQRSQPTFSPLDEFDRRRFFPDKLRWDKENRKFIDRNDIETRSREETPGDDSQATDNVDDHEMGTFFYNEVNRHSLDHRDRDFAYKKERDDVREKGDFSPREREIWNERKYMPQRPEEIVPPYDRQKEEEYSMPHLNESKDSDDNNLEDTEDEVSADKPTMSMQIPRHHSSIMDLFRKHRHDRKKVSDIDEKRDKKEREFLIKDLHEFEETHKLPTSNASPSKKSASLMTNKSHEKSSENEDNDNDDDDDDEKESGKHHKKSRKHHKKYDDKNDDYDDDDDEDDDDESPTHGIDPESLEDIPTAKRLTYLQRIQALKKEMQADSSTTAESSSTITKPTTSPTTTATTTSPTTTVITTTALTTTRSTKPQRKAAKKSKAAKKHKIRKSAKHSRLEKITKRMKEIRKKNAQRKTPTKKVETYKVRTCAKVKTFKYGTVVKIMKGPTKEANGEIKYVLRVCARKPGHRKNIKCTDINYTLSAGKLSVKQETHDAKKVFVMHACKEADFTKREEVIRKPTKDVSGEDELTKDVGESGDESGSSSGEDTATDEVKNTVIKVQKPTSYQTTALTNIMNMIKGVKKEISKQQTSKKSQEEKLVEKLQKIMKDKTKKKKRSKKKKEKKFKKQKKKKHSKIKKKIEQTSQRKEFSDIVNMIKEVKNEIKQKKSQMPTVRERADMNSITTDYQSRNLRRNSVPRKSSYKSAFTMPQLGDGGVATSGGDNENYSGDNDAPAEEDANEEHGYVSQGFIYNPTHQYHTHEGDNYRYNGDNPVYERAGFETVQAFGGDHRGNNLNDAMESDHSRDRDDYEHRRSHRRRSYVRDVFSGDKDEDDENEGEDEHGRSSKRSHVVHGKHHQKKDEKHYEDEDSDDENDSVGDDDKENNREVRHKEYHRDQEEDPDNEDSDRKVKEHHKSHHSSHHHGKHRTTRYIKRHTTTTTPKHSRHARHTTKHHTNYAVKKKDKHHSKHGKEKHRKHHKKAEHRHEKEKNVDDNDEIFGDVYDEEGNGKKKRVKWKRHHTKHDEENYNESGDDDEGSGHHKRTSKHHKKQTKETSEDEPEIIFKKDGIPRPSGTKGMLGAEIGEIDLMKQRLSGNSIENIIARMLPVVVKSVTNVTAINKPTDAPAKTKHTTTKPKVSPTKRVTTHRVKTTRRPTRTPLRTNAKSTHPAHAHTTVAPNLNMIIKGLKALGISKDVLEKKAHVPTKPAGHTPSARTTPRPKTVVALHDPKRVRILCFGDSLTAGYTHHGNSFAPYCTPLQRVLTSRSKVKVFADTKGIVGEMTHKQMVTRLPMVFGNTTYEYDWVIILGGTNDILHVKNFADDQEFLNQLENVWQPRITKDIEKLHQIAYNNGAHTVLLTVPENSIEAWPDYKPLLKMRQLINNALRRFAQTSKGKTILCDTAKKLPRHSLSAVQETRLWDDHLHMTPEGYLKMANVVADCLRPYLPK